MVVSMNAFPNPHLTDQLGMSLRDYMAAKAMQAFLSDFEWRQEMDLNETAFAAYRMADAMLKAREAWPNSKTSAKKPEQWKNL